MKNLFLTLSLLLSFNVYSNSYDDNLEMALRVQTLETLSNKYQNLSSELNKLSEVEKEDILESIINNATDYTLNTPQYRRSLGGISRDFYQDIRDEARSLARTYGIDSAIVFVLFELAEIPLRALFVSIGRPDLIIAMELVRLEFTLTVGYNQLKGVFRNIKEKRLYESPNLYREAKRKRKEYLRSLGLRDERDLLMNIEDTTFVLRNQNVFRRIMTSLRINRQLNHKTLKRLLRRNGLWSTQLYRLYIDRELSDQEKLALMLNLVIDKHGDRALNLIKERFSKQISNAELASLDKELYEWTLSLCASESIFELEENFLNYPPSAHPFTIIKTWEHAIMPYLIDNSHDFTYRQFRRLRKNTLPLRVFTTSSLLRDEEVDILNFRLLIKDYFSLVK